MRTATIFVQHLLLCFKWAVQRAWNLWRPIFLGAVSSGAIGGTLGWWARPYLPAPWQDLAGDLSSRMLAWIVFVVIPGLLFGGLAFVAFVAIAPSQIHHQQQLAISSHQEKPSETRRLLGDAIKNGKAHYARSITIEEFPEWEASVESWRVSTIKMLQAKFDDVEADAFAQLGPIPAMHVSGSLNPAHGQRRVLISLRLKHLQRLLERT